MVEIIDDDILEPSQAFTVVLGIPANEENVLISGNNELVVAILDDDGRLEIMN